MSQFQRRYTERAKRAVAVAQLDAGMSAQAAIDALNSGQLADAGGAIPKPAQPMPKSTAHDVKRRLRLEREGNRTGLERASAADQRATLNRRLVFAADRLTRRVERMARSGTAPDKLASTLAKAATAVKAVHAATADPEPPKPKTPPRPDADPEPKPPLSPLEQIAADSEREERQRRRQAAADHDPPSPSTPAVASAPRAYAPDSDTSEDSEQSDSDSVPNLSTQPTTARLRSERPLPVIDGH